MQASNLNITVEKKTLVQALANASLIIDKRNVLSKFNYIRLSISRDNLLEIAATDGDLYLTEKIGAQIFDGGTVTIAAALLLDIVRKIPDKEIRIRQTAENKSVEILGTNCSFTLPPLPLAEFPVMEDVEHEAALKIAVSELAQVIEGTQISISTEETRYNLNGIYLHTKEGNLYGAATDGHRLSVISRPVTSDQNTTSLEVILPRKAAQEIWKILKELKSSQEEVEISLDISKIKFVCNNIIIISRLIDGTFPEYNNFIPSALPNKLTVNNASLAQAIDRVATVTLEKFRAVKMVITPAGLEIIASGEAKGTARELLPYSENAENYCQFEGAGELSIGFNPKYLLDVLSVVKHPQVEFYFSEPFAPTLIRVPASLKDVFVIMPVKV